MPLLYPHFHWSLGTYLLLAPVGAALAQAPVITAISPMANAAAVARNSPVTVAFSQPLLLTSFSALRVFSSQRGGMRSGGVNLVLPQATSLRFAPTDYPYMPGETVYYTVTTAAATSSGPLAQAQVRQFTTAVGGTGRGTISGGPNVPVGADPYDMALADVDNDGDLDLLTVSNSIGMVSIQPNTGRGVFSPTASSYFNPVPVGSHPTSIVVGDVDNDGDLDFMVATPRYLTSPSMVRVRLNNGLGAFSIGTDVLFDCDGLLKLADMDGDGDLDLVATLDSGGLVVHLNNGNGVFAGGQTSLTVSRHAGLAIGDMNGDGRLDLIIAYPANNAVVVHFNMGNGLFGNTVTVPTGVQPRGVEVGDVDADGDLDIVAANDGPPTTPGSSVSVRLNNGSGSFSGTQMVPVGLNPTGLALGDIDGDGDLDILTTSGNFSPGNGLLSERLNNGNGIFGGSQDVALGRNWYGLILGDVDGDSDLDFLSIDSSTNTPTSNTIGVRLNGGTGPLATAASRSTNALTLYPSPAHGAATLTGATPHAPVTVLDALGRALLTATADAAGTAQLALPEGLPAGVYLVRCGGQVRRLAVE